MRGAIIAVAVLMYGAAIAVFGAGMRLAPSAPPTLVVAQAPLAEPPVAPSPAVPVASLPASTAPSDDGQLRSALEQLEREQAANRELVAELRSTVSQLEQRLAAGVATRPEPVPPGRTLTVLASLLFLPEQVTLNPVARDAVRALLPEVLAQPGAIVSVEGHADSQPVRSSSGRGSRDNIELSLARARAVAAVLIEGGVPQRNVRVSGWGDSRPQAGNDTEAGRAQNRRVEVRLLAPADQR